MTTEKMKLKMNEKRSVEALFVRLSGKVFNKIIQINFLDYDGLISASSVHKNDKFQAFRSGEWLF